MSRTASSVISTAQKYIGYGYQHFLNAFGIGCTAWCAAFVSVIGREACGEGITPWSISCNDQIKWWKDHGCWLGDNRVTDIRPGDYIYYDWDHIDEPKPADHVGIVEKVNGNILTVIEGNFGNAENWQTVVSRRTVTKGWSLIFGFARPKYDGAEPTETISADDTPTLRNGDENEAVKTLQRLLIEKGFDCGYSGADGEFGPATEAALIKFQTSVGIEADGVCGPITWGKIKEGKVEEKKEETPKAEEPKKEAEVLKITFETKVISKGDQGHDVMLVQALLNTKGYEIDIDGDYGNETFTALVDFQKKKGLTADGETGPKTIKYLVEE